jgi:hypothetical protein
LSPCPRHHRVLAPVSCPRPRSPARRSPATPYCSCSPLTRRARLLARRALSLTLPARPSCSPTRPPRSPTYAPRVPAHPLALHAPSLTHHARPPDRRYLEPQLTTRYIFLLDAAVLGYFPSGYSGVMAFFFWTQPYQRIFLLDGVVSGHFLLDVSGQYMSWHQGQAGYQGTEHRSKYSRCIRKHSLGSRLSNTI